MRMIKTLNRPFIFKNFISKSRPISFGEYCNKNIIEKIPRNKSERQLVIKNWYDYIKPKKLRQN